MLSPADKDNFNTLVQAATDDELALMECRDKATGEDTPLVVAITTRGAVTPLARMIQGDPIKQYDLPETP